MNIIYIGSFRLPNKDAAAARVLSIGKALRDIGHSVSFLSWGGSYTPEHEKDAEYHIDGMKYVITNDLDGEGIYDRFVRRFHRGKYSLKILQDLEHKPDVVISYNVPFWFNRQLRIFCKKNSIKQIADITEWYDNNELKPWDWLPNWLNMVIQYKKVPNIISISSYLSNYYNKSNSIIVPALCDSKESKWSVKRNTNLSAYDGITLIYAGTPANKDNIHSVINAVNSLLSKGYKIRFLIVGITRTDYLKKYSSFLLETNLSDDIIFVGRVKQTEVPLYYRSADFMVLLRDNTRKSNAGFPTKFAESMVSGTPVIANPTSDLTKYIVDGVNGYLVKSTDFSSLESLLKIISENNNRKTMEELKKNAYTTGQVNFDFRSHIKVLETFIQNLK